MPPIMADAATFWAYMMKITDHCFGDGSRVELQDRGRNTDLQGRWAMWRV
jgi:hypothetical protein